MSAFSSVPKFFEKITFNPANVPAASVNVENILTGVKQVVPGDSVVIAAPSLDAGLFIIPQAVTTAGSIPVAFWNTTGAAINPASQTFYVKVF